MDMKADQKYYYPDVQNSEKTTKQCSYNESARDIEENPDPLLL